MVNETVTEREKYICAFCTVINDRQNIRYLMVSVY